MEDILPILVIFIIAVGFGLAARYVAQQKGRSTDEGWWFGFLLGPIGLLIEALLPTLAAPPRPIIAPSPRDGPHFRLAGEKRPPGLRQPMDRFDRTMLIMAPIVVLVLLYLIVAEG